MSCSSLQNAQCSLPILFSPLPVQAPVRMGRTPHASLAQIFREVDQGVDLLVAFRAHPGLTWGQVQRAAKTRQAVLGAASALAGVNAAPSTAAGSVEEHQGAAAATRTPSARAGTPVAQPTRHTQHQVEVALSNQHVFREDFKRAHKGATTAYAESKRDGKLRSSGFKPEEIADRWNASMAPDNPYKITAAALISWSARGKAAGSSPQLPGRKVSKVKLALVTVAKTYARLSQLEGDTKKPKELARKLMSSVQGTPYEGMVNTSDKRKHFLKLLRGGDNALKSTVGESIEKRRVDSLTYENVAEWFAGWMKFLELSGFGVWRVHPTLLRSMMYVSKQKRARVVQPDEMHTVMSSELEKGGTRAHLYGASELGASGRSSVVNSRHVSAMYVHPPPPALMVPDGLPRWPRSTVGADGHPLERRL